MATSPRTALASRRARPGGRRRRIDETRREQLLGRLEGLILAEGFADLTVDELATRLQCSKSTLYGVASGKERLVTAVFKRFFRNAADGIEERVATISDPADRIAAYLAAVGEAMGKMSRTCHMDMVANDATFEIWALNAHASAQRVREFIREGVDSGRFRGIHAEFVGESVSLLVDGIQQGELLTRTGLTSGEAYTELSELVLSALTNTSR
ncbi:TetR/AcrR family transcriptional regulator [Streptomyces sp. HNM0575]|uniref:TetR/AcrR family transcriptional regulator n=1 Tax=Streptomyces sp. HNM0575 TaxID=2716338 RepID=UPI00145CCD00|nr:TetR family transcriptional regulator [Streptomyces sp. HNM0575]NLU74000.1 TetR/AcrR family transcriptional regulator [Streptomyces sp. HNM0575]